MSLGRGKRNEIDLEENDCKGEKSIGRGRWEKRKEGKKIRKSIV